MASNNVESYGNRTLLEDLLIEIFLRSPVKSLLRAKCVCKHWYSLIKNHGFNHKYVEYQKNRNSNRLLFQYYNDETRKLKFTILDDINQSSTTYHTLEFLYMTHLEMEGPVNGVYCLSAADLFVLWNPALMEFKIPPLPPPHFLPHYEVSNCNFGFGIDPLTNDHKVILFREFSDLTESSLVYENHVVTLYNLTTNTWRLLDLGDNKLCDSRTAANNSSSFIRGTYYWWVDSGVVLAFDMGNETFRVIPGPDISEFNKVVLIPGSDVYRSVACTIALYEERVAVVRKEELLVNIRVMLEEGIWIKQFSIGPFPGLSWLAGFWKNEGIFLVIEDPELSFENSNCRRLVLYDVNTQEMRDVGPRATDNEFVACSYYYESLVSISGGIKYDRGMVSDFLRS